MKALKLGLVVGLMLTLSAVAMVAADDEVFDGTQDISGITDGRVNHWEVGAPAVIYCVFEDVEGGAFTGIEVLRINSDNQGELALSATAEEIDEISATPEENTVIVSENGYNLLRLTNGEFYLQAPADAEGKSYAFAWSRGDQNC